MKLKPTIVLSAGLLFNPATGDTFAASPVAIEKLNLLQDEQPAGTAASPLLARYEVQAQQLDQEWNDLLAQLRKPHRPD